MARFSLSFISIFLVLAVFALSMPTKRDGQAPSQGLGLDGTIKDLMVSQLCQSHHEKYRINQ
jgi:hypothetical protein